MRPRDMLWTRAHGGPWVTKISTTMATRSHSWRMETVPEKAQLVSPGVREHHKSSGQQEVARSHRSWHRTDRFHRVGVLLTGKIMIASNDDFVLMRVNRRGTVLKGAAARPAARALSITGVEQDITVWHNNLVMRPVGITQTYKPHPHLSLLLAHVMLPTIASRLHTLE